MKNLKLGKFTSKVDFFTNTAYVFIKNGDRITTSATVCKNDDLERTVWKFLVDDYIYDKIYKIAHDLHTKHFLDWGKAWEITTNSDKYKKLLREKEKLLKSYK